MSASQRDDSSDRFARVALTCMAGPGHPGVWALTRRHGTTAALDMLLRRDSSAPALGRLAHTSAGAGDPRAVAERVLRRTARLGMRLAVPADDDWPAPVDDLALLAAGCGGVQHNVRLPLCLWVYGQQPLGPALHRSIAVIGSRAATAYGRGVTAEVVRGLAAEGRTVVSGGALGIDSAAHHAALAARGRTVAVLPSGLDRPYPPMNAQLFRQIADTGLLLSESPPGTSATAVRFLQRNRLVAALSAGAVCVEAARRSGTLQMMDWVLALRRVAMVVPGPVTSPESVGCHALLRTFPSTLLVTTAADVLVAVRHAREDPLPPRADAGSPS